MTDDETEEWSDFFLIASKVTIGGCKVRVVCLDLEDEFVFGIHFWLEKDLNWRIFLSHFPCLWVRLDMQFKKVWKITKLDFTENWVRNMT